MSQDRDRRERSHLQHEAEHARPQRRSSIVVYLAILFAAAFLLLLLSYFMQQRTSKETIDGLTTSVNNLQSVSNLLDQNKALNAEHQKLEDELAKLEEEREALRQELLDQQEAAQLSAKQLEAMDWFWRIQRAYSKGNRNDAKALVEQFEATGLPSSLPIVSTALPEGPSPADQYDALLSALGIQKATP